MATGGVKGKSGRAGDTYGNPMTEGHKEMSGYPSAEERVERLQQTLGLSEAEAQEMADALGYYSGLGYSAIRKAQQSSNFNSTGFQMGEQLEEYIQKSPKYYGQGAIYRGIDLSATKADEIVNTLSNGGTIDMCGTSSWSSSLSTAKTFANVSWNEGSSSDKSIVFVLDKGTKAGSSIKHLSEVSGEDEVLVSKRARYKATSITVDPYQGFYVIHLSESLAL